MTIITQQQAGLPSPPVNQALPTARLFSISIKFNVCLKEKVWEDFLRVLRHSLLNSLVSCPRNALKTLKTIFHCLLLGLTVS